MRLTVRHETRYGFDPAARGVVQSLRLTPTAYQGQTTITWAIHAPGAIRGAAFRDGAGDWIETFTMLGPVEDAAITVEGTVETRDLAGMLKGLREVVNPIAYLRTTRATRPSVAMIELAKANAHETDPLGRAHALSSAVSEAIAYAPGETRSVTTAIEAFELGRGVCQDHAHALIACATAVGLPARYVSGYLYTGEAAGEAAHAWAEIHVDGLGWVGFDPSNRCCPDERYIRLGSGYDATDAAPIRGVTRGGSIAERLDVSVAVEQSQQ